MSGFPKSVRQVIAERSQGVCEVQVACAGARAVHQHHRRNRGRGGDRRPEANRASNGLHCCFLCHAYIGASPAESRRLGWSVSLFSKPVGVPVFYRCQRWAYLDDAGGVLLVEPKVRLG